MTATAEQSYVLGTNDDELQRLGFQNRLWAREASALWERAGFAPGQTILDVGCGPGYATLDLAALVAPDGRVIGVDESPRFVDHLRAQLRALRVAHVDARVGDVQRLDLPAASLDGAYARWVLCFVKNPQAVVAGVARALRPGGVFAVQDYLNYRALGVSPKSQAMARVADAVYESWRVRGGEPDVASILPRMMTDCGLVVREVYPIVRVASPGSALWQWPTTFFRNYLPTLVDMALLSQREREQFESDWAQRSADPTALFCSPIMLDIIAVKA